MTLKDLARILKDEFGRDGWGDIDPYLFNLASQDPDPEDEGDLHEDAQHMRKVLSRVVQRINKR